MSIADRLQASAARRPDTAAVVFGDQTLRYGDLYERMRRGAAALQALGLRPGERIALVLGPDPHAVEVFYAAVDAGLVVVPVDAALSPSEAGRMLIDAGARAAVVSSGLTDLVADAGDGLEWVITAGAATAPAGGHLWDELCDDVGDEPEAVQATGDTLAVLAYTAGAGPARGAMLTHGALLATQDQVARTRLAVDTGDVVLCALPPNDLYALTIGIMLTLSRGATLVFDEGGGPERMLATAARRGASVVLASPPTLVAWLSAGRAGRQPLPAARFASAGLATLAPALVERFDAELGIPLWQSYGLDEAASVVSTTAMAEHPVPGSIGRPLPGVQLRLVDDGGDPVRRGDPGEIVVRGPGMFAGYWNQPGATAVAVDADGWLRTGDIGYAEEGLLYLVDRKTDRLVVSGFNVYPLEVERVLEDHPEVGQAAALGVADPAGGEVIKALVVLHPGAELSATELVAYCRASLAPFKAPVTIEFVDALPLQPDGALARHALRVQGRRRAR